MQSLPLSNQHSSFPPCRQHGSSNGHLVSDQDDAVGEKTYLRRLQEAARRVFSHMRRDHRTASQSFTIHTSSVWETDAVLMVPSLTPLWHGPHAPPSPCGAPDPLLPVTPSYAVGVASVRSKLPARPCERDRSATCGATGVCTVAHIWRHTGSYTTTAMKGALWWCGTCQTEVQCHIINVIILRGIASSYIEDASRVASQ